MSELVLFSVQDGVATITLNRPSLLNAIDKDMARALLRALRKVHIEPTIRAILITGNGRAFCSGHDLNEFVDGDRPSKDPHEFDLGAILEERYIPLIRAIREIEKPFVCALNGLAGGAGASLAFACDFVIASEKATFSHAFSRLGLVPDSGSSFFLPRLVGFAKATELMMLGDTVTASEAFEMRMIYRVYKHNDFYRQAEDLTKKLASQATVALGLIKRALNRSLGSDLNGQLCFECDLQRMAGHTEDFSEGIKAFVEKRDPNFCGR